LNVFAAQRWNETFEWTKSVLSKIETAKRGAEKEENWRQISKKERKRRIVQLFTFIANIFQSLMWLVVTVQCTNNKQNCLGPLYQNLFGAKIKD
jgi:hypothetical protein